MAKSFEDKENSSNTVRLFLHEIGCNSNPQEPQQNLPKTLLGKSSQDLCGSSKAGLLSRSSTSSQAQLLKNSHQGFPCHGEPRTITFLKRTPTQTTRQARSDSPIRTLRRKVQIQQINSPPMPKIPGERIVSTRWQDLQNK